MAKSTSKPPAQKKPGRPPGSKNKSPQAEPTALPLSSNSVRRDPNQLMVTQFHGDAEVRRHLLRAEAPTPESQHALSSHLMAPSLINANETMREIETQFQFGQIHYLHKTVQPQMPDGSLGPKIIRRDILPPGYVPDDDVTPQ